MTDDYYTRRSWFRNMVTRLTRWWYGGGREEVQAKIDAQRKDPRI